MGQALVSAPAYTALARKWRPRSFEDLVGQEHVLRALQNALDQQRVHHAFLFTGTRGVGKTTIARILAKCLNCEQGVSSKPCGVCDSCREIDEGRFVDLIEVDAASRTKVDDTRELLDNVQYLPTRGRHKVYLIDEVHMLSTSSFNALLKTLEEPPPHVKFLLATTDPQKLPATVLSRCLQFNLKRLPIALIAARLEKILVAESIEFESAAIRLVARSADGSLRDGLSLLDQLIAFSGDRVTEQHARSMLGTIDQEQVVRLVELLAEADPKALLDYARSLEQWSLEPAALLDGLAALLGRIAIAQVVPDDPGDEAYPQELLARLAARFVPEDLQLYYQTAILGSRDLPLAPDAALGLQLTLLRMLAFRPATGDGALPDAERPATPAVRAPGRSADARIAAAASEISWEPSEWPALVESLELSRAARQLALHCSLLSREGVTLRLQLEQRHQTMRTRAQEEKLAQALSKRVGEPLRIEIELSTDALDTPAAAAQREASEEVAAATRSLQSDPTVRALQDRFGAVLQNDSVRPHKRQ